MIDCSTRFYIGILFVVLYRTCSISSLLPQFYCWSLLSFHIPRRRIRINVRWYLDVQGRGLEGHGVRIDLTHVLTPIFLLNIGNMEIECGFKVPGERYPGVISYDSVKEGENSFGIRTNPTNLKFGYFGSLFSFWIKYFRGSLDLWRSNGDLKSLKRVILGS